MPNYEAVAEELRKGFQRFRQLPDTTEADIRSLVIDRVLAEVGYPSYYRRAEHGVGRNRPDEVCYTSEPSARSGHAAVIVEAKPYGTDFDKPVGGKRSASPDRQIQRYLRQHPASGPNTIGVLTDGARWRIYERTGSAAFDIRFLTEYDLSTVADAAPASARLDGTDSAILRELVDCICRECVVARHGAPRAGRARTPALAERLFAVFGEADGFPEPDAVLHHLLGGRMADAHHDLAGHVRLEGIVRDAHETDWQAYAYALGAPLLEPEKPTLEGRHAVAAAVRFADAPYGLSRADAALCARTFARVDGADASVVLAWCDTGDGGAEARLAACVNGRVSMTAPFDPELPAPSARAAIESVLGLLAGERAALDPDRLLVPLEVAPLRQQFYADVSAWTKRLAAGRNAAGREAVLRHLIRVMFAWILKEDGLIPAVLFERAFASSTLRDLDLYHVNVLRYLFQKRLDVEDGKRDPHPDPAVDAVMDAAPFLNGSLFREQEGDNELDIPSEAYWNADPETPPGLFTIFSRYHWTTDEHRPGESEQTLDPELLSNLFERLILPIETGETLDRQPRGTYYTPADVTAEMCKDALAAAVRNHAPAGVTDGQLLGLFGDPAAPLPVMSGEEQGRLAERIRTLRVFDPAVGSGAFLFGCLTALRTALGKLDPDSAESTPRIIREQLHGQDIHPLAAQITRLRLFIALKAADRAYGRNAPLPNLEARIVCADTLETSADPAWRPDHPGRLDTADPELVSALTAVAENRGAWMEAHTEQEKQAVLRRDSELRDSLRLVLGRMGDLASPELWNFAETPILPLPSHPPEAKTARTDARLLFYESPWRGFDVVIGNPPYEALSRSMDAARRKALAERKRYRTTNCGDLYPLFCEAALALARPEGGGVTLIVPLSIAFGQQERTLRRAFEECCTSIDLRHYDNRPDTVFNASPTVMTPENSQRATILTAALGKARRTLIRTTGLQHWHSDERNRCLAQRRTSTTPLHGRNVDIRIAGQWPRIPTLEVSQLISVLLKQKNTVADYQTDRGVQLGFPLAPRYFVSTIPAGAVSPRGERIFTVADNDAGCLVMAVLNGHVGYGWWRVYGDGFHLNEHEVYTLPIPDSWATDPKSAIRLGRRLKSVIPDCIVENKQQGGIWRNVDFHRYAPDLIAEIDRLYIEALGLPLEPLLTHLKIMRSNRSWDFSRVV